jgi:hypothetical protein
VTVEHINVVLDGDQKAALVAKYAVELGVVFMFSKNGGMPQFQLLKSDYPQFQKALNRAERELHPTPCRFKKGDKVVVRGFDMALVFDHYSADGKLARVFIEGESWDTKHSILFARPLVLAPNDTQTMNEEGWVPDLTAYQPLTEEFKKAADIEANTPITAGRELIG